MYKKLATIMITASLALASIPTTALQAETTSKAAKGKPTKEQIACVGSAVSKRDTALKTAFDSFSSTTSAAYSARLNALSTAWTNEDTKSRRTALSTAWKAWREASTKARRDFRAARTKAWAQFTIDRKSCGTAVAADDNNSAQSTSATESL